MSTINPPTQMASANMGLKITLTILGTIGCVIWGISIGFLLGWRNGTVIFVAGIADIVSIINNAAMICLTCRLLFLVMNPRFGSEASLDDLHKCVARLVACTLLGFTTWVDSLVWLSQNSDGELVLLYHGCNYGFVVSAVIAGLGGGLLRTTPVSTGLPVTIGPPPKYHDPHARYPQSHQGAEAQYTNPAYGRHYESLQQRTYTDERL